MNYDNFDHTAFFGSPEPEPVFRFSDDDPPVHLPPDLSNPGILTALETSDDQRSWQTRQPSVEILDEINDKIAPYADTVVVAICDTGENPHDILPKPLAMESFIPGQSPFDGHSHGTHVGGTSAGKDRRYTRFVGFQHIVAKVLSNGGSGSSSGIQAGCEWAIDWIGDEGQTVDVMNFSLGGGSKHQGTIDAMNRAASQGIVVGAAAGNEGQAGMGWPARDPSIAGIAAMNENGTIASFSSRGQVLIADAGSQILSASNRARNQLAYLSGTSMATPCWCNLMGAVICLRRASGLPRWRDNTPVFELMKEYGIDAGRPGYDMDFGYGYADIQRLLTDMAQFGPRIFTN